MCSLKFRKPRGTLRTARTAYSWNSFDAEGGIPVKGWLSVLLAILCTFGIWHSAFAETVDGQKIILQAPVICQKPELYNGCEVTSLAMLLQYAGIRVGKMELARRLKKEEDPLMEDARGNILRWGDPDQGFVGDITGKNKGYAVHAGPLQQLMEQYLPERTIDLTGEPFDALLRQIRNGKPVIVWTTAHFTSPTNWIYWQHHQQRIKATMDLHVVLLVGFDDRHVYVNNPWTGERAQPINREPFIASWNAMGRQALSYQ
jgi:uncharacterized protein YvpB